MSGGLHKTSDIHCTTSLTRAPWGEMRSTAMETQAPSSSMQSTLVENAQPMGYSSKPDSNV